MPSIIQKDINKISQEDFDRCMKFIDRSLDDGGCVMWIEKDKEYKNMEVIVLFHDEFYYKVKGRDKGKIHNETLAMDSEIDFKKDFAISIRKKDIGSISVYLPPLCDCGSPSEPHQPKFYELEINGAGIEWSTIIHDRQASFVMYETIRDWRYGKGLFKKSLYKRFKSFIKNNF